MIAWRMSGNAFFEAGVEALAKVLPHTQLTQLDLRGSFRNATRDIACFVFVEDRLTRAVQQTCSSLRARVLWRPCSRRRNCPTCFSEVTLFFQPRSP